MRRATYSEVCIIVVFSVFADGWWKVLSPPSPVGYKAYGLNVFGCFSIDLNRFWRFFDINNIFYIFLSFREDRGATALFVFTKRSAAAALGIFSWSRAAQWWGYDYQWGYNPQWSCNPQWRLKNTIYQNHSKSIGNYWTRSKNDTFHQQ